MLAVSAHDEYNHLVVSFIVESGLLMGVPTLPASEPSKHGVNKMLTNRKNMKLYKQKKLINEIKELNLTKNCDQSQMFFFGKANVARHII